MVWDTARGGPFFSGGNVADYKDLIDSNKPGEFDIADEMENNSE